MDEVFNLESFIEGVNRDRSKEKGANDRLKRVLMNVKDNQGTVTFIPIIAKNLNNIYAKIERVREYNGKTSFLDAGFGWYKILPIERYEGITPTQMELYNEVVSLYDAVMEWDLDWDEIRIRNYSIFTGIVVKQIDTDGNEITDLKDVPCLLVYPSNSPIDSLNTAIKNKASVLKDKLGAWLGRIINPANKGHQGVIQISFKKNDGPGYNSTVNFEMNDEFTQIVDPKKEYSAELISKFDDPIQVFLGWCYDYDNKSYFNETLFNELKENLTLRLKELESGEATPDIDSIENKNSIDPMIPGVDAQEVKPEPKKPF